MLAEDGFETVLLKDSLDAGCEGARDRPVAVVERECVRSSALAQSRSLPLSIPAESPFKASPPRSNVVRWS